MTWVAGAAVLLLVLSGCASTGTPRPPSLRLPQPVRDLQAERFGDHIDLHWTAPTQTTDHQSLVRKRGGSGPLTAEVCRVGYAAGTCAVIAHLPAQAGEMASLRDTLAASLLAGPPRLLRYRIRFLNGQGRSADWSRDAAAIAGAAPPDMMALRGATTDRGMQITWERQGARPDGRVVLVQRPVSNVSEVAGETKPHSFTVAGDPGGTVDPTLQPGQRATYTVYRSESLTLEGLPVVLNGEAATVTVTREADTFAPAVPQGLLAVGVQLEGAAPEIDLSWEPDSEPDLLGYFVYRAEAGSAAAPQRLNAAALPSISYRDLSVIAGRRYRYSVSAVDRSGNESARSPVAEEQLRP